MQETLVQFLVWKIPWRRDRLPTSVFMGFPSGSGGKESTCNPGDLGLIPAWEDPPEAGMATIPVLLPGESPWTEEPDGLQSTGSQRVGYG